MSESLTRKEWTDVVRAVVTEGNALSGSGDEAYWYELADKLRRLYLPKRKSEEKS